jgi:hypothetical protein
MTRKISLSAKLNGDIDYWIILKGETGANVQSAPEPRGYAERPAEDDHYHNDPP